MDELTKLYEVWMKEQGLDLGSADEHLFDENLTDAQRQWLGKFCEDWEKAEDEYYRSLRRLQE